MNWPCRLGNVIDATGSTRTTRARSEGRSGRRRLLCSAVALVAGLAVVSAPARAQPNGSARIPFNVNLPAYTGAVGAQVGDFVEKQAAAFTGEDGPAIVEARKALLAPLTMGGTTDAFMAYYGDEIGAKLSAAYDKATLPGKLNIAIVAERVAATTKSTSLAPLVAKLVSEDTSALVSWGLRAAAPITPRLQNNPNAAGAQDILKGIAAAPTKFIESQIVIEDTYKALVSEMNDGRPPLAAAQQHKAAPPLIETVQAVIDARLEAFKIAGTAPVAPLAELQAFRFLRNTWTFPTVSNDQRGETLRSLNRLLDAATGLLKQGNLPLTADRDLRLLVNTIAKEAVVLGPRVPDPTLTRAADMLVRTSKPSDALNALLTDAGTLSTQLNRVADTLSPPKAAPATGPASQP